MRTKLNLCFWSAIFLVSACSPSPKEKEEIAVLTCNIIRESGFMDAAFRIKEINSAREKIGEDRFLGTDREIRESLEYNLCKELVLNDQEYETKLDNARPSISIEDISIPLPLEEGSIPEM